MSEIQKKLEERRAYWEKMLNSPDWEKYKAGGDALASVEGAPLCYPNHSLALGLPFKEGTTDSRASWFFYQLGANGGQIASFIREMLTLDPEEQVEYGDLTATESLEGGNGQPTHVTSLLSSRFQYGEQQVVILDIGSHHAKAGWAAENTPAFSFPSVAENGTRAVERGVVVEWEAYEWLIQESYRKLETKPESYPLIFCIAPKTPLGHKVRIAKYLFETLKVPSVFFCTTSYAGLCWSEKFHGLVVNVGAGIVHTVPYYEGICIAHAIQRSDVAGQDITANLINTCRARGDIVSEVEAEIMKCKLYTLTPDPTAVPPREDKIIAHGFRADGAQVPLGQEVILGSEILFRPDRTQKENLGIPEMIQKTISQCDIDTRKALWSNIIVCGGASMVPGFTQRLQTEVSALTPGDTVAHVNCPADRLNNTHMGANNIAFYDDFYNLCITADEFAIEGENIFEEKCNN